MQQPFISIITPVYRVEQYLNRCLDSILTQSFKDWECILIDDGSPDDSGKICDEYVARDPRFYVFHKENGGVSSARNVGLNNARGEFVTFIDADDYVGPDYLQRFANHKEYDLIFTGLHRFGSVDQLWFGDCEAVYPTMQSLAEAWMSIFEEKHLTLGGLNFVACKALRTKYIKENNLRFDSRMKKGEDTCFVYEWMKYGKNAIQIKGNEYYYFTPAEGHDFRMTLDQYQEHCSLYQQHIEDIHKQYGAFSQKQLDAYVVSTFNAYYYRFCNASINDIKVELNNFRVNNTYPVFDAIRHEKGIMNSWIIKFSFYNPLFYILYLRSRIPYNWMRKMARIIIKEKLLGGKYKRD